MRRAPSGTGSPKTSGHTSRIAASAMRRIARLPSVSEITLALHGGFDEQQNPRRLVQVDGLHSVLRAVHDEDVFPLGVDAFRWAHVGQPGALALLVAGVVDVLFAHP